MRQGRIQRRTRSPDRSFADIGVSTEAIDTYPFDRMAGMPFPTITTASNELGELLRAGCLRGSEHGTYRKAAIAAPDQLCTQTSF